MTGYTAIARFWDPKRRDFELVVERDDGHEVWGDISIWANSIDDMPRAAEARLQPPVAWRVAGPWTRDDDPLTGPRWRAPAAVTDRH